MHLIVNNYSIPSSSKLYLKVLMSKTHQPSLLSSFHLLLDVLNGLGACRGLLSLGCRRCAGWVCQDHIILQPTLWLLLASDLGSCNIYITNLKSSQRLCTVRVSLHVCTTFCSYSFHLCLLQIWLIWKYNRLSIKTTIFLFWNCGNNIRTNQSKCWDFSLASVLAF